MMAGSKQTPITESQNNINIDTRLERKIIDLAPKTHFKTTKTNSLKSGINLRVGKTPKQIRILNNPCQRTVKEPHYIAPAKRTHRRQ